MAAEEDIRHFAQELYGKFIASLNAKECPFSLFTQDDATFPEFPGITAANLRNVLIGGDSSGSASFAEFTMARVEYDASWFQVSHSIEKSTPTTTYTPSPKYDVKNGLLDRMQESTQIITDRIWSTDMQKNTSEDHMTCHSACYKNWLSGLCLG